ncbi:MAG: ABC transporter permease [Chitinophagales bacterium]|jgi:lipoprotein-releasing system permease protein|nr:ABC transporter permease [Bacteroidota bacterium]MBK7566451.1 ABC transporter permease [Bacteroidota bacterium]MBP9220712.1 ABC transporter permease [Chitinophagales bacterium]
MKFTFRIAWRYIFSKKSTNAINIISGISMTGIIIGSASLIIVLSAFNGFENLVDRLYSTFYPDITISAAKGKVFVMDSSKIAQIQNIEGVEYISKTLEENVLLAYNKQEHIATIKGVDTIYKYVTAVDDSVYYGDYILDYNYLNYTLNCAVLGSGVASTLNVSLGLDYPAIQIFMPRRGSKPSANPRNTFIQKGIQPMGVFRIQQEFDSKYVITSLGFISELLEYSNGEISTLEIKTSDKKNVNEIIEKIQLIIGEDYIIKNRFMQNEFLYRVMKTEKWAVYFILTFIFIIAAFNMIGSIAMLVIDKKKDIGILRSLGASEKTIRNIFFFQGVLQTLVSITIGFTIASILCVLQMKYGFITIPGQGTFVVTAYPIALEWKDYLNVFLTVFVIGSIASYFPAYMAARQKWLFKQE